MGAGVGAAIADRKANPATGLRDKMKDNPQFQDRMQDIKQNGPGDKAGLKDRISQLPADRERPNRGDVHDKIRDRGNDLRGHVNDRMHHRPFPGHLPHYPHHPHWGGGHGHWWRWASASAITRWCVWGPRWGQPIYYDYGSTIYYDTEYVYVNDEPYATTEQYAEQAMELADAGAQALAAAPEVEETGTDENWMSLGVFALANSDQGDPIMYLQLAVDKQGIIAGTYYNSATETSLPITGKVDSETQRAAWTIGENKNTVMETGVYNLTEEQTSVLVHFGKEKQQTWMMARLDEEAEEGAAEPAPAVLPLPPAANP